MSTLGLALCALSRHELACLHTGERLLAQAMGTTLAPGLLGESERRAVARKLVQMQLAAESEHVWFTYWLAIAGRHGVRQGLGLLGFKGPPNCQGSVEIAYSIAPCRRGQGFATAAAAALLAWAFEHPDCTAVLAPETPRANLASTRVLEKLGMRVFSATDRTQSWRIERGSYQPAKNRLDPPLRVPVYGPNLAIWPASSTA